MKSLQIQLLAYIAALKCSPPLQVRMVRMSKTAALSLFIPVQLCYPSKPHKLTFCEYKQETPEKTMFIHSEADGRLLEEVQDVCATDVFSQLIHCYTLWCSKSFQKNTGAMPRIVNIVN